MLEQQLAQLNQQVIHFYREGRFEQAIDLATQACDLIRRQCGPQHPDLAAILADLANLYRAAGNPTGAEPLYQEALAVARAAWGEQHPEVATSLTHLAAFYEAVGNETAAEPLYQQAVAIRR